MQPSFTANGPLGRSILGRVFGKKGRIRALKQSCDNNVVILRHITSNDVMKKRAILSPQRRKIVDMSLGKVVQA